MYHIADAEIERESDRLSLTGLGVQDHGSEEPNANSFTITMPMFFILPEEQDNYIGHVA